MNFKTRVLGILPFVVLTGCSGADFNADFDAVENVDSVEQSLLGDDDGPITAPIAYWKFDSCAGNVVPNEQGSWGQANLAWGASCAPGVFGNAGVFDGVDDRAWTAYDARLDFTYEMTVSAWVKPTDPTSAQTILGKWYSPDSYLLWFSAGYYRFSVALADGRQFTVSAPATQTSSGFSEVVGSYQAGSHLRLSVNGDVTSLSIYDGTKVPLQPSNRNVTIGNHPSWNAFEGQIDEVKLFDVANPRIRTGQRTCAMCNPPSRCCEP